MIILNHRRDRQTDRQTDTNRSEQSLLNFLPKQTTYSTHELGVFKINF